MAGLGKTFLYDEQHQRINIWVRNTNRCYFIEHCSTDIRLEKRECEISKKKPSKVTEYNPTHLKEEVEVQIPVPSQHPATHGLDICYQWQTFTVSRQAHIEDNIKLQTGPRTLRCSRRR
ncbi:hypothetical protein J6590_033322 [Homalodisca vitripennis]|nr:hypothetical protein J6590_033322 [Homalodisca vitripennis]